MFGLLSRSFEDICKSYGSLVTVAPRLESGVY